MNDYILLLRNDPAVFSPANMSSQRAQEVYGRYRAWREQLASEGILAGSHKLEDETGRVMRATNGNGKAQILDGPYIETKEVLGGFFVVKAESYEAAVQIARGCPHFEFGSVEVRRVEM
jgi:hypothetical protein